MPIRPCSRMIMHGSGAGPSCCASRTSIPAAPGRSMSRGFSRICAGSASPLDVAKASALAGPLYWHDGDTEVLAEPQAAGDVILARKDAPTSYHLAVTVDDAAQRVTDVVRGRDLYPATDIHRLLQSLLAFPTPHYHHHPLLLDAEGRRLAKRTGAPALAELRAGGADPG